MIIRGAARLISLTLPTHKWYYAAFTFTKKYANLKSFSNKRLNSINHASKLNALLSILTSTGKPFAIPIKANGVEVLQTPRPNGLVLCSVHIPLIQVSARYLVEQGLAPDAVIVKHPLNGDAYPLLGISVSIPVIYSGTGVLLKAKSFLKRGKRLIVLADYDVGSECYSPNIFYLADNLKVDIIYFFARLQPDGYVEVSFLQAPDIDNKDGCILKSRISVLNNYRNNILDIEQGFNIQ